MKMSSSRDGRFPLPTYLHLCEKCGEAFWAHRDCTKEYHKILTCGGKVIIQHVCETQKEAEEMGASMYV